MTEFFEGNFFMWQPNYPLVESKWCCLFQKKKKKKTHTLASLKQITGCSRKLRVLLRLSLLSEICLFELHVITGFCLNGQGEIILGHQYEIYIYNLIERINRILNIAEVKKTHIVRMLCYPLRINFIRCHSNKCQYYEKIEKIWHVPQLMTQISRLSFSTW